MSESNKEKHCFSLNLSTDSRLILLHPEVWHITARAPLRTSLHVQIACIAHDTDRLTMYLSHVFSLSSLT